MCIRDRRGTGHVIHDTNGEVVLGGVLRQVLIHGEHALGRGVLRAQAIAAAHNHLIGDAGASQSSDDVQIQGCLLYTSRCV